MFQLCYSLEFLHGFYADGRARQLRLVPTADCGRLLAGHRMMAREVDNRLYVLSWADSNSVPFIPLDPPTVFRFYLMAEDPEFHQFTSLPYRVPPPALLYFSNLSGNSANSRLYLTQPNPAFDVSKNYAVGDMASSGANLYECVQSEAANPGNKVNDPNFWFPRGEVRAPGPGDVMTLGGGDSMIDLAAPAGAATVTIFGLNRMTHVFDVPLSTATLAFPTPVSTVPVVFGTLPAGKYRVTAGGVERFFYYDPAIRPGSVLGVVEIFNHLPAANAFALMDVAGRIKGSVFSVWFSNLLAVWKYIARTANVKSIKDKSGVYQFDNSVARQFRSKTPIPLTNVAYGEIAMDYKPPASALSTYENVPNPRLGNLKQIAVGGDLLPCAEIYLNY